MGAPPVVLQHLAAQLKARRDAATVAVWPEHWHAVTVFRLMATQWRAVAGMGGMFWLGLDYAALPTPLAAALDLVAPIYHQPLASLLLQLQVLESAAAKARNEKA